MSEDWRDDVVIGFAQGATLGLFAGLLGFVYLVMRGFDWLSAEVDAEQVITFGEPATEGGPRVPWMADGLMYFVIAILLMVAWYARNKFTTVCSLMLSTWDRGNWYMLPMLFVLMTIGFLWLYMTRFILKPIRLRRAEKGEAA